MWKIATALAILVGIIIAILPLIYWIQNAHLTQMQIFLKFWWLNLIWIPMVSWGIWRKRNDW